jgi:uncharacterized protein (TIGR03435 family)
LGEEQILSKALRVAYMVPEYLIEGPDWMRTECIKSAVMATSNSRSPEEFRRALMGELADRLALTAHKEFKEVAVFALKLPADGTPIRLTLKEGVNARGEGTFNSVKMPGFPISMLAEALSDRLRRPVVDETGLSGSFDIALDWKDGSDLPKSVKDQLGLELVPAKRAVQVLVVDHVEKWPAAK